MVRAAAEPAIKSPAVMNVAVNNVLHRIIASTYPVVHAHTLVESKSFRTKVNKTQGQLCKRLAGSWTNYSSSPIDADPLNYMCDSGQMTEKPKINERLMSP